MKSSENDFIFLPDYVPVAHVRTTPRAHMQNRCKVTFKKGLFYGMYTVNWLCNFAAKVLNFHK